MELITVPDFYLPGVANWDAKRKSVEYALSLGLPRLQPELMLKRRARNIMTVACYGPSLKDTYRDMVQPIMSVSGAHDWLIQKRITPTYHVECDPRAHKAGMLSLANDTTKYLIASCCHPEVFAALKGRNVKIWHLDDGEESRAWYAANDPDCPVVCGGSTVGLRALEIVGFFGYGSIEVHGMDCSFDNGAQWAGAHTGRRKDVLRVRPNGMTRAFDTSALMIQAAREGVEFWRTHHVKMKVKGGGLFRHMLQHTMEHR